MMKNSNSKKLELTFFSNEKKKYNSAISRLLSIEDLQRGSLGKRDDRILQKEADDPFKLFHVQKSYSIIFIPINKMMFSRKIFKDLADFFEQKPVIATPKNQISFFKKEFPSTEVIDVASIKIQDRQLIFYAVDHIMNSPQGNNLSDNSIFIDCFLNIKPANQIENFLTSYETYKDIFMNIFKPVLEDKFKTIFTRLSQKQIR